MLGSWQLDIVPGITSTPELAENVYKSNLSFLLENQEIKKTEYDFAILNAKGFGGNNGTSLIMSPLKTTEILQQKHTGKKWKSFKKIQENTINELENLTETIDKFGFVSSLISTSEVTHATPAAFAAHVDLRSKTDIISSQMIDSRVATILGGGRYFFTPEEQGGKREDGRNLLDEIKESHIVLTEKNQLSEISSSLDKQVLGLFADEHLRDEDKKDNHDLEPSLAEMLQYSITRSDLLMNQGCEGFFIMAEGSQVDWAGHVNDFDYLIREMEDFDEAVDLALEIAKERQDTLVLVTSDHEVGGLLIEPANPIDNSLDDVKFSFNTAVGSGTHTGVPVPVYAYGPGSENFTGTLDNTDIYYAMLAALDLDDKKGSCLGR